MVAVVVGFAPAGAVGLALVDAAVVGLAGAVVAVAGLAAVGAGLAAAEVGFVGTLVGAPVGFAAVC